MVTSKKRRPLRSTRIEEEVMEQNQERGGGFRAPPGKKRWSSCGYI
jgi:hypothetical protein